MFGQIWEMKQMFDKYKTLQSEVKNLLIVWREGTYEYDENGEKKVWDIVVKMNGEMKLIDFVVMNKKLLSEDKKEELETLTKKCFEKTQNKVKEVVSEKTQKILWFDPTQIWSIWNLLK